MFRLPMINILTYLPVLFTKMNINNNPTFFSTMKAPDDS